MSTCRVTTELSSYEHNQAEAELLFDIERECDICKLVCPADWFSEYETICNECAADGVMHNGYFEDAGGNAHLI